VVVEVPLMWGQSAVTSATSEPEPRSARQMINEMLDAGLLDELIDRVDAGELTLTGGGRFLPEMVKRCLSSVCRPSTWATSA
jgi:putative transposase